MHEHEARLEKLLAEKQRGPEGRAPARDPDRVARRRRPDRGRARSSSASRGSRSGYLPGRGAMTADGSPATEPRGRGPGAVPRRPARRADRDRRAERRGQDHAAAHDRRGAAAARRDADVRERGPAGLPRAAPRRRDPGDDRPRRPDRGDPRHRGRGARSYLARFLFRGDDVLKEVRLLSGGERSRLELALLGIQPSNLLLLDEPTNHLDIPAREAIESFMAGSPATLLVVSHDRRLLETVCEKLWVVDDGAAAPFDGGYRAWRTAVAGGWTVAGALEAEAKRLHGGRRTASPARRTARPRPRRRRRRTGRVARPRPRRRRAQAARPQAREALEGRLPEAAGRARRRADPARACARTTSSSRSATRRSPPTSSSSAASPASWPTSTSRSPPPRTPGSSSRSARRDRAGSGSPGRSAAASRPSPAGSASGRAWSSSTRTSSSRGIVEPGTPTLDDIVERFGPEALAEDGTLDRARLGRIVFGDATALADLEAITGPPARARIMQAIEAAESDGATGVVIEAIRLLDGGLATVCDEVWLVTCDPGSRSSASRDGGPTRRTRRAASRRRPDSRRNAVRPAATRGHRHLGSRSERDEGVDRRRSRSMTRAWTRGRRTDLSRSHRRNGVS